MAGADQNQGTHTGFEHILPENTVEYFVFHIDDDSAIREQIQELEVVRKTALRRCQELTKDYIWQRGVFGLEPKHENGESPRFTIVSTGGN